MLSGGSRPDTPLAAPGMTSPRITGSIKVTKKSNKKRGPGRGTITLGGLNKIRKARKRKAKRKLRRKLGRNNVHVRQSTGRKAGPLSPTRSVLFMDNTAGGMLPKRFQQAEEAAGDVTCYRMRIPESAGTPLSMLLPSTNP